MYLRTKCIQYSFKHNHIQFPVCTYNNISTNYIHAIQFQTQPRSNARLYKIAIYLLTTSILDNNKRSQIQFPV